MILQHGTIDEILESIENAGIFETTYDFRTNICSQILYISGFNDKSGLLILTKKDRAASPKPGYEMVSYRITIKE